MKVYTNSLGITCIEPNEGYLLKKGELICKKAYLGVNDRVELYEEIIDENYVFEEKEEVQIVSDDLINLKKELIKLSKSELENYLENNPLFSRIKYSEGRYYSVNNEHQTRLASQLLLYQANVALGLEYQLTWNDTGSVCEDWTFEELFMLSNEINNYVKPLVKKQQELEVAIRNTTSKNELNNIKIKY